MSKGGQPQQQQQTVGIDPYVRNSFIDMMSKANTTADQLGVQQFAGFDPMYAEAEKKAYELGMKPFGAEDIQRFQNPYEQTVVDQSLADIETSRQMQAMQDAQSASQAKAFGGSRQGVQAALTNEAALKNAARTAGQLRSAGFNTAAALAQNARGMDMAGLQNVMNLGLTRQQFSQKELDAIRNLPMQRLGIMQSALSTQPANLGQTTSLSQNTYRNVGAGVLGGAAAGSAFGPYGALAGGILGAIG